MSNVEEIKARGGPVIAIATEGDEEAASRADELIAVPPIHFGECRQHPRCAWPNGGRYCFSLTGWVSSGIPSFFGDQSVAARHEAGMTGNPLLSGPLGLCGSQPERLGDPTMPWPRLPSETARGTCNSRS